MAKKRFSAERIVTLLRQIEVMTAQGKLVPAACREAGISEQSFLPLAQGIWRAAGFCARIPAAGATKLHAAAVPSRWDNANAVVSIPLVQKTHHATPHTIFRGGKHTDQAPGSSLDQ